MRWIVAVLVLAAVAVSPGCSPARTPLAPGAVRAARLQTAEARLTRGVDRCDHCHDEHVQAEATHYGRPLAACDLCHAVPEEHRDGDDLDPARVRTERHAERSCDLCHEPVVAPRARRIHGALSAGPRCTGCHEPHGRSTLPRLLRAEEPELCFECHERFHPGPGATLRDARCSSCHGPHDGPYPDLLSSPPHAPPVPRSP